MKVHAVLGHGFERVIYNGRYILKCLAITFHLSAKKNCLFITEKCKSAQEGSSFY